MSNLLDVGGARFDTLHSRGGDGNGTYRYPSPFFDIGHTYLPTSIKKMLMWCRYYFMTNPLINAVTYKMAEYPVTQIVVDQADSDLRSRWTEIIEHQLRLRTFLIETGLDYFAYGNAFVTIHYPFNKYLVCGSCKDQVQIEKAEYKFRNLEYHLFCEKCQTTSEAKVKDLNIKSLRDIRLIRWNPEYVSIEHNDVTGESDYFFEMTQTLKNDILMGKRHIIEKIPDVYVRALREGKSIKFTRDNFFHLKRPTIAQKDMGWGMPIILPVLKDTYYLQILRKAQEAIAQQHIVPLRILFPQAGSASSDPYSTTDLGMWRKRIEGEIQKWRLDPNYIPILPLPVGNEVIGGEGRSLMLHQEMRAWSEQIVAGMHVPIEFIFGGLQYSGSNVSMRMLENQFLGYRTLQLIMVRDFILGRIADYMSWERPKVHFKRFKMADDLQRSALLFQFNQAMKISDTSTLDDMDLDVAQEEEYKKAELQKQLDSQKQMQIAQATIQGEVQLIQARYQAQVQQAMAAAGVPPPQPGAGGAGAEGQMPGGAPGAQDQQPAVGQQALAGMPDGATAYPENGQQMPTEGIPQEMQSPLNATQMGGNFNLLYLARRAATQLSKLPDMQKYTELMKMRGENPQLYMLVNQLLQSEQGAQADALNPLQSPLPELKPSRRQSPLV